MASIVESSSVPSTADATEAVEAAAAAAAAAAGETDEAEPCCYMGFCPRCMEDSAVLDDPDFVADGEALPFSFVSLVASLEDAEEELSGVAISHNEGPGGVDDDGAPFVSTGELQDGQGGMLMFVSTRPLRVGEAVTMSWNQTNRASSLSFGLTNGEHADTPPLAALPEGGTALPITSVVDLNVFDEHLNLFVPDELAEEGHEYDCEQVHLVNEHDAVRVARPGTRISLLLQEGNVPAVQFGNLDKAGSERQWLEWCPDGAGLKPDTEGHLYPVITLMFEKGKAPPAVRNVRLVRV